jgi:hypothetical protein
LNKQIGGLFEVTPNYGVDAQMRKIKENVVYSKEFREVVLQAYPDNPEIAKLLENNAHFLGRYLDDGCCGSSRISVTADEIITAIGLGQQEEFLRELLVKANCEKLKSLAYKMWGEQWYED